MNNSEREQWIENDESLYLWRNEWCRRNKGGTRAFIREHRAEIDATINSVLRREPLDSRSYSRPLY